MKKITVQRVDFVNKKIGSIKRTDEGYLSGSAAVAKVGVLTYYLKDGSTRRELVTEETLFNEDSMSSLKMKPITNQHPQSKLVNSRTVKEHKVGFTGENIKRDGEYLTTPVVITDNDAIESVDGGTQELSPGYKCEILIQKGTTDDGKEYDAIQMKRTYNHVAICDKARGGSDLRLNLDRCDGMEVIDAVLTSKARSELPDSAFCLVRGTGENKIRKFPAHDAAHVRNGLARLKQANITSAERSSVLACLKRRAKRFNIQVSEDSVCNDNVYIDSDYLLDGRELTYLQKRRQNMPKITINNIDYEVEQQEVANEFNRLNSEIATIKADAGKQKDELSRTKADLDTANEKLDNYENEMPGKVTQAVKVRLQLERTANDVLDKSELEKIDSLSDIDLKKTIILKEYPTAKLDDKDEVYLDSRIDAITEQIVKLKKDNKPINDARKLNFSRNTDNTKNDEYDGDKARERMIQNLNDGWKKDPLERSAKK